MLLSEEKHRSLKSLFSMPPTSFDGNLQSGYFAIGLVELFVNHDEACYLDVDGKWHCKRFAVG